MESVSCPRCGAPLHEGVTVCPYCRTGFSSDSKPLEGWVQYRDEWFGFALAHPPGWIVETRRGSISVREDPAGITVASIFPFHAKSSGNIREVAESLADILHTVAPSSQTWIVGDGPSDARQIALKTRDIRFGSERDGILNIFINGTNTIVSGYAVPSQAAAQRIPLLSRILSSFHPIEQMPRQKFREPAEGAFTLFHPQGWEVQGMLDRSSGGGFPAFNVARPPQGLVSAGKPSYRWTYQEPGPGMFTGVGTNPRQPFMTATQFCQQVLAPWISQSQVDFKIASIVDRPDLSELSVQGLIASGYPRGSHEVSVGILETCYAENGVRLRQKTQVTCTRISSQFTFGIPSWIASLDVYYRAPEEELSTHEPVLRGILDSFTINRAWEAAEVQRIQGKTRASQMDIHHRLGQISQTISETNDMVYNGYMNRRAIEDRMAERRSDATLGVHSVESPAGHVYQVSDGYDQYWMNGLGDFYGGTLLTQPDVNWIPLADQGNS